jgi:RHS repeat-associated protein
MKSLFLAYPFGSPMPNRSFSASSYRYGFNGKEKDTEGLGGSGATYDYGFRIYNPNLGRFLSVDPLSLSYPFYTPYQYAGNRPVWKIDLDGLEDADSKANKEVDKSTATNKKVAVDAGHGGDDGGTPKINGKRNEADVTLKVAEYTKARLEELNNACNENVEVTMTRTENKNPGGKGQKASLDARVKIGKDVDLFLSIHVDAAGNGTADKVSVYTKVTANQVSKTLQANVVKALTGVATSKQGIFSKEASHQVTRDANKTGGAVLVEIGYMTNAAQETLFNDDSYLQKLGNALGDALYETAYPNATNKDVPPPPVDNKPSGTMQAVPTFKY